jgi:hypothetical protein
VLQTTNFLLSSEPGRLRSTRRLKWRRVFPSFEVASVKENRSGDIRSPRAGFETRRPSLRFDGVGSNPDAPHQVYGAGSGIPFYGGRRTRYLYIVTNRLERGETAEGFWDPSLLPPGDYILRGWAADVSGNVVDRDLPVAIGANDERR